MASGFCIDVHHLKMSLYSIICVAFACIHVVLATHPLLNFGRQTQTVLSPDTSLALKTNELEIARTGPEHDTAGKPNLATRIEVTSQPNATLFCATDEDKFISGYAHFTNSIGVEDKHMFWW